MITYIKAPDYLLKHPAKFIADSGKVVSNRVCFRGNAVYLTEKYFIKSNGNYTLVSSNDDRFQLITKEDAVRIKVHLLFQKNFLKFVAFIVFFAAILPLLPIALFFMDRYTTSIANQELTADIKKIDEDRIEKSGETFFKCEDTLKESTQKRFEYENNTYEYQFMQQGTFIDSGTSKAYYSVLVTNVNTREKENLAMGKQISNVNANTDMKNAFKFLSSLGEQEGIVHIKYCPKIDSKLVYFAEPCVGNLSQLRNKDQKMDQEIIKLFNDPIEILKSTLPLANAMTLIHGKDKVIVDIKLDNTMIKKVENKTIFKFTDLESFAGTKDKRNHKVSVMNVPPESLTVSHEPYEYTKSMDIWAFGLMLFQLFYDQNNPIQQGIAFSNQLQIQLNRPKLMLEQDIEGRSLFTHFLDAMDSKEELNEQSPIFRSLLNTSKNISMPLGVSLNIEETLQRLNEIRNSIHKDDTKLNIWKQFIRLMLNTDPNKRPTAIQLKGIIDEITNENHQNDNSPVTSDSSEDDKGKDEIN